MNDGRHARVREILYAIECYTWRDFKTVTMKELEDAYYKAGKIDKFNKFDRQKLILIKEFQKYLRANQHIEADLNDHCSCFLTIWDVWRIE